jgi:sigma-B regulation protein RsbU (phosphoserine phosphatase)
MGISLPLGIFEDVALDLQSVSIPPESTLLLYTDGVTEAFDGEQSMFGETRLKEILASRAHDSSQALCDSILETVSSFGGDAGHLDDITVVAVRAGSGQFVDESQ